MKELNILQMEELYGGWSWWGCILGTAGSAVLGGLAGAAGGSAIPGIGTTAGGIIGGIAGGLVGAATFCQ